ncbi:MAG: transglutaminase domain-containing protein [Firmicutes bacterium]|nr:transglutaminase domain-containing protein [Bacillota bacterium]
MKKTEVIGLLLSKRKRDKKEKEQVVRTGLSVGRVTSKSGTAMMIDALAKAAVVFLNCFGIIECFAGSCNIPYDREFVGILVFIAAFIFAVIRNIGGIAGSVMTICAFAGECYGVYKLKDMIKGIVLMMMNYLYPLVQKKYNFPDVDGFPEMISDKNTAFTILFVIVAVLFTTMMSIIITDAMSLIMTVLISVVCLQPWLFLEVEPRLLPVVMLLCSFIATAVLKFNYKYKSYTSRREFKKYNLGEKIYYTGSAKGKTAAALIFCVMCTAAVCTVVSKNISIDKSSEFGKSEYKELSDTYAKNVMIASFSEYKKYMMSLRISGGQLGNYSSVEFSGETYLKAKLMPYKSGRTYLKSYIGSVYSANEWSNSQAVDVEKAAMTNKELAILKDNFENTNDTAVIKAKMEIENIKAPMNYAFVPYYTDIDKTPEIEQASEDNLIGMFETEKYVPLWFYAKGDDDKDISYDDSIYRNYVYENYLAVPDGLNEKLQKFCEENGFSKDDENLEEKLSDYFDENYEYTLNPGLVPWQTDFVDYFLFSNKKGFCVHFASAGAMIYRSLGIPARYVEGYAIDENEIIEGTEIKVENKREWLGFYNDDIKEKRDELLSYSDEEIDMLQKMGQIGEDEIKLRNEDPYEELEVREVNVKDSSGHAWVEIYKDGFGWVPVELTPPDYKAKAERQESIMESVFLPIDKVAQLNTDINRNVEDMQDRSIEIDTMILWKIFIVIAVGVLILCIKNRAAWFIRTNIGGKKKKLSNEYEMLRCELIFLGKMKEGADYTQAAEIMSEYGKSDKLKDIMERAAFSAKGISEEEMAEGIKEAKKIRKRVERGAKLSERVKMFLRV